MSGKILLIDDDRIIGSVYSRKLSSAGFEVRVELDGAGAQRAFEEFEADLYIIDIGLPDVHGLEILKAIRDVPEYAKVPVIIFSNSLMFEDIEKAMELGATEIIDKSSCPPALMLEKVSRLAGRYKEKMRQSAAAIASQEKADDPSPVGDTDIEQAFLKSIPPVIQKLSASVRELSKSGGNKEKLLPIFNHIHPIAGNAGSAGFTRVCRLAEALESLVKSLYEKPAAVSSSATRTIAQAVDTIAAVFADEKIQIHRDVFTPKVLIVEDDRIAARLATRVLEKIPIEGTSVESAESAMELLDSQSFDLFLLDAELPGMSGDEFCRLLRQKPAFAATPVIFVTSLSDFDFRAKSVLSGGNDILGKPYIPMELAVKILTHILKAEYPETKK